MKYYIYSVKSDGVNTVNFAAVHDPASFAMYHYDPEVMEYTGVSVEATDPLEAVRAYGRPSTHENSEIFLEDEPTDVINKRKTFEANAEINKLAQDAINAEIIAEHSEAISKNLIEVNEHISRIIDVIANKYSVGQIVGKDFLYRTLKRQIIDSFNKASYNGKPDKS